MYTFDNRSQSIKAVCFVLLELSILNRLHKESRLIDDPGNLSRAKINVSTISFFISSLPSKLS